MRKGIGAGSEYALFCEERENTLDFVNECNFSAESRHCNLVRRVPSSAISRFHTIFAHCSREHRLRSRLIHSLLIPCYDKGYLYEVQSVDLIS